MSLVRDTQGGLENTGSKVWIVCVYVCIVCICVYVVGTCDMWHLNIYVCVCGHVCSWEHAWWRVWHQNWKIRPISAETRRVTMNAVWETSELEVQHETASSWIKWGFGGLGVHLSLSMYMELILVQCSSLMTGIKESLYRFNHFVTVCG